MFACFLSLSLLLVVPADAEEGSTGSKKFRDFLQDWPTPGTGPSFDTSVNSNITGLVGKTVTLNCRVKNLGNRTVSGARACARFNYLARSVNKFQKMCFSKPPRIQKFAPRQYQYLFLHSDGVKYIIVVNTSRAVAV